MIIPIIRGGRGLKRVMIQIIIEENVYNYGRPLKFYQFCPLGMASWLPRRIVSGVVHSQKSWIICLAEVNFNEYQCTRAAFKKAALKMLPSNRANYSFKNFIKSLRCHFYRSLKVSCSLGKNCTCTAMHICMQKSWLTPPWDQHVAMQQLLQVLSVRKTVN